MRQVLVIEDSPDFAAFVNAVLRMSGYQVQQVTRLDAGLQLLSATAFDLVLLDLSLPDGDGLAFFEHPAARSVRVVAMTSRTDDAVLAQMSTLAAAYFIKPISARDLTLLLQQVTPGDDNGVGHTYSTC
jgi:DNA-binding response OmpR family regulator